MRYNKIHDQLTEEVARTMYQYKLSITGQKEQPTADSLERKIANTVTVLERGMIYHESTNESNKEAGKD